MRTVAWFQVGAGAAMLLLWGLLLGTAQVPEVSAGQIDIWFHLGAEVVTAALLLAAGAGLLRARRRGPDVSWRAGSLSALAFGALLYTTINSGGYYAQLGEWPAVATFGILTLATIAATFRLLVEADVRTRSPRPRPRPRIPLAHRSPLGPNGGTPDQPSDDLPDPPGRHGAPLATRRRRPRTR